MVELLAPAGNLERLKYSFIYGADAVYFAGKKFGMRANAENFSDDEIQDAVLYAHKINKKVYVTVNIVFHEEDFAGLDDYLIFLDKIKVDGVIVSDIAVIDLINKLKLNLFIVLSTQDSVMNINNVLFWKSLGVNRIVLARESNRDNIKEIIDKTGIEIETFIHGSMCTSISGKCVLSNYLTNRDANRGGCVQACRWCFNVKDKPSFTMMSKDLNLVEYIPDLIDIGVSSFKIEGRMRSIYYLATIILAYRRIIDLIYKDKLTDNDKKYYLNVLNRCANRESAPQFYNGLPSVEDEYWNGRDEKTNQDFLGIVLNYDDDNHIATIEQRNYIKIGDEIQFFGPNIETFNYKVNIMYDEHNEKISIANHPRMIIKLPVDKKLYTNDILRIKIFDK